MGLTCRVRLRLHYNTLTMSEQGGGCVVEFSVALAGSRGMAAGICGSTQVSYPRRSADRRLPVATYPLKYRDRLRGCAVYPRKYGDRLCKSRPIGKNLGIGRALQLIATLYRNRNSALHRQIRPKHALYHLPDEAKCETLTLWSRGRPTDQAAIGLGLVT